MNTGGWHLLALVVSCSGQVAWPVQSFSPEVARQLQAALSSMPAADIPTVLHLGVPSVASSVPIIGGPAIHLSTVDGPREKLAPVVELPLAYQDAPYPVAPPIPSIVPQSWFPATPRTVVPPAAPQAAVEEPFYLTAATRLRLPSAPYPQAIPVPYIPGFAGFSPPHPSFAHDSFAFQAGPSSLSPSVPYFYPSMNAPPPPPPSEAKYSAPDATPYPADPHIHPPFNQAPPASPPADLNTYHPFDLLPPATSLEAGYTFQEPSPSNPISLQFLSTHDSPATEQSALIPGFSFESVRTKRRRF